MPSLVTPLGDSPNRAGEPAFDRQFWKRLKAAAPKTPFYPHFSLLAAVSL